MALDPNIPVVAPLEVITAAHTNAVRSNIVRLDTDKLDKAGGTVTGNLTVDATIAMTGGNTITGIPDPAASGHAVPLGFADGRYVNVGGDTMTGALTINTALEAVVAPNGGARMLVGKAAVGADAVGVQLLGDGRIGTTVSVAGLQNLLCTRDGGGSVSGQPFIQFRTVNQDVIGSITMVGTTAVAYNTSSDARLKTVISDVDVDQAATVLRALTPVVYAFNAEPDRHLAGFIAQDLAAAWPDAVTVGAVNPGVGEPGVDGFVPWQIDTSRLVPMLVAAWQNLDARLTALEGATP